MISSIVFDVDDTLVYYENLTYSEWYEEVCLPLCEELNISLTLEDWISIVEGKRPRTFSQQLGIEPKTFWKTLDKHNLNFRKKLSSQSRIKKFDDTVILKSLPVKIIAYSSSSVACAEISLKTVNLYEFFHGIYGKDLDDYKFLLELKPNSGLLKEILKRENIKPEECLVVGDSLSDYISGIGAGCKALLIDRTNKYKNFPRIESLTAISHYVYTSSI